MLVGITYDLRDDYLQQGFSLEAVAEFDSESTISAIDEALNTLGYETIRIGNITKLVDFLSQRKTCDIVYNIAEGMHGLCREAQIPALLDAYTIPYVFSDSFVLAMSLHKGVTKAILREQNIPTPPSVTISRIDELAKHTFSYPLFIKPVGGGTGMGIHSNSIVRDKISLYQVTKHLLAEFAQPVLVEGLLEGREFTVGIVGTDEEARALAVMEICVDPASDQGIYSYNTKQEYRTYARYHLIKGELSDECVDIALRAYRALGCRDCSRVDLKMDSQGNVHFLEINPLAGLNPVDSDLPILCQLAGISYTQLIDMIMESAIKRVRKERVQWIS